MRRVLPLLCACCSVLPLVAQEPTVDWLVNPAPFKAVVPYAGLSGGVQVSLDGGEFSPRTLDKTDTLALTVNIPVRGRTWVLIQPGAR